MTTSSVTTVEKYIETFPIPTLSRITGTPTYESVKVLNEELNANATSIVTTRGGGAHGCLALTISPAVYATLSETAFVIPVLPDPVDPEGLTGPQIAEANRQYEAQKTEFHSYVNLQNALKKQLVGAIEPLYLQSLRQPYVGYANVTTFEMLRHLYETYADISADDLETNDVKMKEPWDPNQPFEQLVKQIQDAIDMADHAGVPYTPQQIVNVAYNLVERTGMFEIDCRVWREREATDEEPKNWTAFKQWFKKAHKEWEKYSKRNGARARYGQANAAITENPPLEETTINALANFATSTASDRAALSKMTDTIQELTAELSAARKKIDELSTKLAAAKARKGKGKENANPNPSTGNHYCFRHGFMCEHSSRECTDKQEGHQDSATKYDTKGGSQHNLDKFLAYLKRNKNRK